MKHKSEKKLLKNSHSLRTTGNASWVSYTLLGRRKLDSREVAIGNPKQQLLHIYNIFKEL